ncbi:glycosyltransferase family protein [Solibacillus sp. FSL H8-0538]|uniref:glycosyltransferase family protein n=1 Tax=Solibacillus sp. FSL H8-0538 TaxID=2921400 RepID=UPI0030FBC700
MNLAILQARMSSSRLPGKVMKLLLGKPMLLRQIERIKRSNGIDALIVATTTEVEDDEIAFMCKENNILCYRGSLENVLDRFYKISIKYQPDNIIRLTGDCPLIDPDIIDKVIECHLNNGNDYTSNIIPPTFPDGLDTEVFTVNALEKIYNEANRPSLKEHVTLYVNENPYLFKRENVVNTVDLSLHRWTVDEQEDYELVCRIYENLFPENPNFNMHDILHFLEDYKELQKVNAIFTRNEGLTKSLQREK